jgi:hypothetical protein
MKCSFFRQYYLRQILVLILLIVAPACISAPGAGSNRSQLFSETQPVVLPFRIVVDERSRTKEEGTILQSLKPSYENTYNPGYPLGSTLGYGLSSGIDKLRRDANSKEMFLSGEAFESAMRKISYSGTENVPKIAVELIQFQPVKRGKGFGTDLIAFLLFNAYLTDSSAATQSSYRFDYAMNWSDDKNDILREMIDYAVGHWAKEFLTHLETTNGAPSFPPTRTDRFRTDRLRCKYDLFSPFIPDEAHLAPAIDEKQR